MNKLLTALALAGLTLATTGHAQTADPKTEWAAKVVALQQGPELDRLVDQLTESSAQDLVANWGPKLDANVPKAKQAKATEELNAELKNFAVDIKQVISSKVGKIGTDAMVPAYAERFTVDELKQLAAFFESPAIKKYQAAAPELGNIFVQKLLEAARPEVAARAKQFNEAATKIVGSAPPAGTGKPAAKK
ncbi:DUF2059 domain-containing protein [Polaromonas sp.]|uniref:DUF2059 domain-containing protein n=1 Tax=Polaromonas sp. TaxID=1869339 RepID=UPI002FCBF295